MHFDGGALETDRVDLAAALRSLGIAPMRVCPIKRVEGLNGGEKFLFYFEEVSACGRFRAREMVKAFRDAEWDAAHPGHPLVWMKETLREHAALLDVVMGEPIERPGEWSPPFETQDLNLAAALRAEGVKPVAFCPVRSIPRLGGRPEWVFYFEAGAQPLGEAWRSKTWHEEHGEEPFAYRKAVLKNRTNLMKIVKRKAPTVVVPAGRSFGFLRADCTAKEEIEFFRQLRLEKKGLGVLGR